MVDVVAAGVEAAVVVAAVGWASGGSWAKGIRSVEEDAWRGSVSWLGQVKERVKRSREKAG